jgi:hypothetical protein
MNTAAAHSDDRVRRALDLLDLHADHVASTVDVATEVAHPLPIDTRAWSQIIVSVLSGIKGLARKKGTDLVDGSDVKAASTWHAIDTPRFNNVIKAGTRAVTSGKLVSLDTTPHLFFVLWDYAPITDHPRCRIWAVRPQHDEVFRGMCERWYALRDSGGIRSNNFQLHPPRHLDLNTIRNTCGNLDYPLYFRADRPPGGTYHLVSFDPAVLETGTCTPAAPAEVAAVPMEEEEAEQE